MIVFSNEHVNCWDILIDFLRHVSRNLRQAFVLCAMWDIDAKFSTLSSVIRVFKLKGFEPEYNEKTL